MKRIFIIFALLAFTAFAADIDVKGAFVKVTPPNAKNTAIFLSITNNTGKDIELKSASSDLAPVVELHTHKMEAGKMKMVQVPSILIKAHESVELKPMGLHIMLFNIKNPVKADTKVSLKLNFSDNKSVELKDIAAKKL